VVGVLGDLGEFGDVELGAVLTEGARNEVVAVRVDRLAAVARRSRRGEESLDWELDLLEFLAACDIVVPRPIRTAAGARRIGTLSLFTWIDGHQPATTAEWEAVRDELRRIHRLTVGWPQRPGFASAADLLTMQAGGDVDLGSMPPAAVEQCRRAWAALPAESATHVVHGDPGRSNLRIVDGRVAVLDWDEARVDHAWFDLADLQVQSLQPVEAVVAQRAAHAWEAANGWRHEPDYAAHRLRLLNETTQP
jgi:Ser/Thr protein kinase RdoA (MazF antagonist)